MKYRRIINEAKQNLGASPNIKARAKDLRMHMTAAENLLWKQLRRKQQNGKYFRRQHPYGIYILDFYCFEADLVIELDGGVHIGKKEYDEERTKYLESSGLNVLRFKNEEIETKIDWALVEINKYLKSNSKKG
jgi:very-short-patch-repair endonuclease